MKLTDKSRVVVINLLIAAAISAVANFSFFTVSLAPPQEVFSGPGREMRMMHNSNHFFIWIQTFYWFATAFVLLSISTHIKKDGSPRNFWLKVLFCIAVASAMYMLSPALNRDGVVLRFTTNRIFSHIPMFKLSLTLIVSLLYGKIFELVYQKQGIIIENERLKNENLLTRYNMLVSQINPHFFFNSLNSLAMLVRSGDKGKALTYIDRLSDTFRFIIQKGQNEMITLKEELDFLEGYKYVHEVRYADKLFFDIDIDPRYAGMMLPALSLQPLIENAVKHNSITLSKPFRISIRTEGAELVVSNPVIPKIEPEKGTGIGLKNLSSRFVLLTGRDITVTDSGGTFTVRIPLSQEKRP